MDMKPTARRLFAGRRVCTALALMATCAAWAAGNQSAAEQRYQQEKARCMSGQSQQDRATCLKEARNALAEARRGRLDNGQQAAYKRNALARCQALPAQDQADCVARAEGRGTVSGSVEGGGLYKETTTVQIGTPPAAGSNATPAAPDATTPAPTTSTSGTSATNGSAAPAQPPKQ
ncbi:hypothetical protein [Ideonella sp. BN130291]|uniref:hypothetical protein n=1 Tax=Ideonella sp. BN130291 TaxID=3112940 RepID=UPI002E272882|nr:hypothetical protein [Ideonella sp. BN130291]